MIKDSLTIFACVLLFSATAMPSISSIYSPYDYGNDHFSENVIVSVQITDKGLYNLVVSIQTLEKPSSYKYSNTYREMMRRFMVDARGITTQKILNRNELSVSDFAALREEIDAELSKLADVLVYKYFPNRHMNLVYSISDFFLLKPGDY